MSRRNNYWTAKALLLLSSPDSASVSSTASALSSLHDAVSLRSRSWSRSNRFNSSCRCWSPLERFLVRVCAHFKQAKQNPNSYLEKQNRRINHLELNIDYHIGMFHPSNTGKRYASCLQQRATRWHHTSGWMTAWKKQSDQLSLPLVRGKSSFGEQ